MDSHILNMYHQARYRTIGHKIMRSMSESLSSESSCNQNSPEYSQDQASSQYEEESNEGKYWDAQNGNLWSQNQKINITKNQDSSIDEEDIDVQDVSIDEKTLDSSDHEGDPDTMEENSLIEGADYDVIQVFAVDPDLDLEGSSEDEEQEEEYEDSNDEDEGEYLNEEDRCKDTGTDNIFPYQQNSSESICQDNLGINLDTLVVSNVDEYFIKENKDILAVKDEPVVKDVDEYFIKNIKEPIQPTVEEDFLIPTKLPDEPELRIAKDIPSVEEFLATVAVNDTKVEIIKDIIAPEPEIEPEVPLNESDLEVLPNIEDLKRYLLEDIPYNKLKSAQRSCSVPHSPIHNICLDIDAKTCLSFEDLNLDLSDLSFENVKDKSNNSSKSDDIPRTLTEEDVNSFLITSTSVPNVKEHDDFCSQDMEIDRPIESLINSIEQTSDLKPLVMTQNIPVESIKTSLTEIPAIVPPVILQDESTESKKISRKQTLVSAIVSQNTPVETITSTIQKPVKTLSVLPKSPAKPKPTVLDFCIEKNIKKDKADVKAEVDDFVDVESCNDTVIPVLEANNLNSLLEQFEATEKLNTKTKTTVVKIESKAKNLTSLTNGMRLQDAGVQLNKTKMRQILMPSTINTTVRRSPSPVHSDHDYCSTKKRHSLPNIKGGRSLLKPEVLSSNHRILSSRHRSCKNKKIVYHQSSDEESEKCNDVKKKVVTTRASDDDSDIKKKSSTKQILKTTPNTNYRKNRISPVHTVSNDNNIDKSNGSVMVANASKASDTACSQNSNGSIKLTIKNKSEVIIKNCDSKDNHEIKIIEKDQSSSVESSVANNSAEKSIVKPKQIIEKSEETETFKEENSKPEDFYVTLFPDKKDVQIPQNISKHTEKRSHDDVSKVSPEPTNGIEIEQPQKKKKLNLQEYKLRRGATSNNSSAQVSPEAIFPEMPCNINLEKDTKSIIHQKPTIDETNVKASENSETAKKIFDPIREASRKILMNSKKQKAEATRKRDEDIVMSKIPKVDNLELQPLISDAEMMKIVGMSQDSIIPIPIASEIVQQPSKDYDEIILVSVGTNTEDRFFKKPEIIPEIKKHKVQSPPKENKSTINFKIRKSDNVLKQNVFDSMKNDRSPTEEKKSDMKIDEERYKGITATLKSVGKHVDTKISSNSLFASIQDVVMKKATNVAQIAPNVEHKNKPNSPVHKQEIKYAKPIIVRDFDETADHGEDKVILHLEKNRKKPESTAITIQTDSIEEYKTLTVEITKQDTPEEQSISPRKRNDSDMSMSSECSPVRKLATSKSEEHTKHRNEVKRERSLPKDKRSRSKERHEIKYRRSRSHSRGHRRNRSRSRTRSRSRGRFRRYRRSDSPYRRKRRSRSPYGRRSPSLRRDYRSNRSRSRSRYADKAKSPIVKKPSPQKSCDKKFTKSLTPPIRKPTVSESSDTSTSSSSSSGSSSSGSSRNSRRASSAFRRNESRNTTFRKSYSSEDRESNTPVEERRIVFVGRLEQDITKAALRSQFTKFGPVTEVRLHSKEDGTRYGFVTYQRPRDAWSAVEAAATFPQYDVGFGGRRAFCRQSYADLDGLEAKYTESAFHGQAAVPPRRSDDMSFEQMLLDIKKKLNKRKGDKRPEDSA